MLTRLLSVRPTFFIWFRIKIEGEKNFTLALPMPLTTLILLSDIVNDAASVWNIFHKSTSADPTKSKLSRQNLSEQLKNPSPKMLLTLAKISRMLVRGLIFYTGSVDLIDVEFEDGDERIYVKCLLR
ncbi:MAG: hypothetical protein GX257_04695 [Clostridiales bacterium]|jgi:hypothetical protein|nr:hypothetical protein [Clostridiales bacterium]